MEYIIICTAAGLVSTLTLFSGFGLGTLLLPVFAVFFPIEVAIALTAVVHLLNNLFKLSLIGKYAEKSIVLKFGLPAILAAFFGAKVLFWLSGLTPLIRYQWLGRQLDVTPVKLAIACLMASFALFELSSASQKVTIQRKYLPFGGILSGFFGGLSGHQGAVRSAFLIKCGLSKETFIGTGVVISCMVDVIRMIVYSSHFTSMVSGGRAGLLIAAVLSAFLGAWMGRRYLRKVTMRFVQAMVTIFLFGIAAGLATGVL